MTVNTKIRHLAQYDRGIWDWALLRGCFGETLITPTDIDACIERKGHFLWIETKLPGIPVPRGQEIVLHQLTRRGDTVLIVHGQNDKPEHILKLSPFGAKVYENADAKTLRKLVNDWWLWANQQVDPPLFQRVARLLLERFGKDYCRAICAEWARVDRTIVEGTNIGHRHGTQEEKG